jgi:quercetin dioxygenase-like cupin family protein
MKFYRKPIIVIGTITAMAAAGATIALANPGSLATTTILGHRATLSDSVKINQDQIKLQTKVPTDVQVQTITFGPRGFSGWHYHPGVVIVVVESGLLTTHDEQCRTTTYGPHESFVESGTEPFMVSNDSDTANTIVYATFIAPAGSAFRIETNPPPCAG